MENMVQALMSKKLVTIDIIETAENAAQMMKDRKTSYLLVVDIKNKPEEPLGIVTERDFVHKIDARGVNSKDVAIGEIMSSPIATTTPTATIEGAASLMVSSKTRHLLVVDMDKRPIGIIGPNDLTRYLKSNLDINEVNARILQAMIEEGEFGDVSH